MGLDHSAALLKTPAADVRGATISLQNVSKRYATLRGDPVLALDKVSLDIGAGEFVSIVGPSGCGKSTLMTLIAGLVSKTSGRILVDGLDVQGPIRGAGVVFQKDVLMEWRNVLRNVLLPVEVRGLEKASHLAKAQDLLCSVGLSGFEERYPAELSGGMRQRVSICRALVQNPALLLMDEPFGALDALTREQMATDLQKMWMRERSTVVFITHSIEEAVLLSDRVVVMSSRPGQIADILEIDMPRPRGAEARKDPRFVASVDAIRRHFMALGILSES